MDVRRGEDKDRTASLKFWTHDSSRNAYKLSAQVEHPHGSHARVNAVCLHASKHGDAVCVSGGSDGSIKLWKAQKTPQSDGGPGSKDALSWTCAFSFKHKDSPVLACALSRDGTALALSQENIISVWDPAEVSLRATLIAPCSDAITFIAFVEPRAAAAMGGGAGQAYLVAGSKTALYVFDLLTLQLSWCANGDFQSFAIATSEQEAFAYSPADQLTGYAYIAASVQSTGQAQAAVSSASKKDSLMVSTPLKPGRKAKVGPGGGGVTVTDDEAEDDAAEKVFQAQNHVCFFSLHSPVPVVTQELASAATHLCFTPSVRCGGTDEKPEFTAGLLCITEGSELVLVAPSGTSVPDVATGDILARDLKTHLPGLPDMGTAAPSPAAVRVQTQTRESLASLFNERSEALPAVSQLSNSFLGRLLRENVSSAFSKTAAASASPAAREEGDDGSGATERFLLPGMEAAPGTADGDVVSEAESESRVFYKRGRPRSMSFEARTNDPLAAAATKQAQDSFLCGRVDLLGQSLLSIFAGSVPAGASPAAKASKAPAAQPSKGRGRKAAHAMEAVSEEESSDDDEEEESSDDEKEEEEEEKVMPPPAKKSKAIAIPKAKAPSAQAAVVAAPAGRARRSSSITSTASDTAPAAARASRSRSRSELSDVSEGSAPAARSIRKRADSATSDTSQDTTSSLRRSSRR